MSGSLQFAIALGVSVAAFCVSFIAYMLLPVLKLRRPRLVSWGVLVGGALVAALPWVAFGSLSLLHGLALGVIGGSTLWAGLEARARFNQWLYVDWPAKRAAKEAFRAYQAPSAAAGDDQELSSRP